MSPICATEPMERNNNYRDEPASSDSDDESEEDVSIHNTE